MLCAQNLSQMGAIIDFTTGAAFFRNITEQSFVHLERETNGHLYVSLVEDMLSRPILDKSQLHGFQTAAQFPENLYMQGQRPLSACADGTNELQTLDTTASPLALASAHRTSSNISPTDRNHVTNHSHTTDSGFNAAFYNRFRQLMEHPQEGRMASTDGTVGTSRKSHSWIRKYEQEPAGGQGTTATVPVFRQPRSQDVPGSSTVGPRTLPLDRSSGGCMIMQPVIFRSLPIL